MAVGGEAPWALAVMWILTMLTAVFVALRLYTRLVVIDSFGMDDTVYIVAFLCLVGFSLFISIAAHYGFGQHVAVVPHHHVPRAVLFEAIGQSFVVMGMAIAKMSLGFFFLRIVQDKWQRIMIWIVMSLLMIASLICTLFFWFHCTPFRYLWDHETPNGHCGLPLLPSAIVLGTACVLSDFFFAIFPWFIMWNFTMNPREKYIILGSMSLGVIAGAFGIVRSTQIPSLSSPDYLHDTVHIVVWSAAEVATTMVCIGVPILRPLYKQYLDKWIYTEQSRHQIDGPLQLRTIGGTMMVRTENPVPDSGMGSATLAGSGDDDASRKDEGGSSPRKAYFAHGKKSRNGDEEWGSIL